MKKLLIIGFLAFATAAIAPPSLGRVTLAWTYPTNEMSTDLTFKLYWSTNISIPLTNWQCITNVIGTNLQVTVQVNPGLNYFAMTATNMWEESVFSNVARTPYLPRSDSIITIQRTQ